METRFNFQINPDDARKDWEDIPVIPKIMPDRIQAIQLAKKVSRLFKAEVRLTEGNYPYTTSGAYFHHAQN